MANENLIYSISGPIVKIAGPTDLSMQEMVHVGEDKLVGEVISINEKETTIQVYEETAGIRPGERVYGTTMPIKVQLGPGLINNIYDGIERPLVEIEKQSGYIIKRGVQVDSLDKSTLWHVKPVVKVGDQVSGGAIIAEIPESNAVTHKVLVPPTTVGEVIEIVAEGDYTIEDILVKVRRFNGDIDEIKAYQEWPIRQARPVASRFESTTPQPM